MPWVDLLFLIAVAYVVVLVVRGLIQVVPWFIETFVEPRRYAHSKGKLPSRHDEMDPASSATSVHRREREEVRIGYGEKVGFAILGAAFWLTGLSGFLKRLFARRDFTYWVGLALGESDPEKKVKYCSRALQLNPGYEPAWGLKALTLLDLKRHEEAVPCFDRVLEMRPNSMAWHCKGLCCYYLQRHREAIACFDKVLTTCADKDRRLADEASRHKKLAQEALDVAAGSKTNTGSPPL
jgi:tetratricopeptide (TPR) repeat protein